MKRFNITWTGVCMMLALCLCLGCSDNEDSNENEVEITFSLENENGELCTMFGLDDDIVFALDIGNKSSHEFVLKQSFDGGDLILDIDCFRVYDMKGNDQGVPWTGMFPYYVLYPEGKALVIAPGDSQRIACSRHGHDTFPFCAATEMPQLEAGNYYTEFTVVYNRHPGDDKTRTRKTFRVDFQIRE